MMLLPESSCTWASRCGRYQVILQRKAAGLTLRAQFYGFIAHQMLCSDLELDLVAIDNWCEQHRRLMLPRIVEFERWVGHRYGVDLSQIAGPFRRRDRIADLILNRGESGLRVAVGASHPSTLGQLFAELYQSITPEPVEESGAPDSRQAGA